MGKEIKRPKILVLGHKKHGKDTFGEIITEVFDFKYKSSSVRASEIFIYDELKDKYGYETPEECFEDRDNHRKEWYELIGGYNKNDKARLAKEVIKDSDCYIGMRDGVEIDECVKQGLFDLIIWVDASERLPLEGKDSFNIDKSYADIIIDNNQTLEEFRFKTLRIGKMLKKIYFN